MVVERWPCALPNGIHVYCVDTSKPPKIPRAEKPPVDILRYCFMAPSKSILNFFELVILLQWVPVSLHN